MNIIKASRQDIDSILAIYAIARKYMEETGNGTQWGKTRPEKRLIEEDIRKGQCFIGTDNDGKIHFVFAFILGNDLTYTVIEGGNWLNDQPYGVIHRIASDMQFHGVFKECLDFCKGYCSNIRIDTHENNLTMRHLLKKHGFTRCGIIYLANGEPRIAYQLPNFC